MSGSEKGIKRTQVETYQYFPSETAAQFEFNWLQLFPSPREMETSELSEVFVCVCVCWMHKTQKGNLIFSMLFDM